MGYGVSPTPHPTTVGFNFLPHLCLKNCYFFIIHKESIAHITSIYEDLRQRSTAIGPWITFSKDIFVWPDCVLKLCAL